MNENESKNFGIFKEISGYLGSLLGICTKLELATLAKTKERFSFFKTVVFPQFYSFSGCIFV